jgi:hypothetical protein
MLSIKQLPAEACSGRICSEVIFRPYSACIYVQTFFFEFFFIHILFGGRYNKDRWIDIILYWCNSMTPLCIFNPHGPFSALLIYMRACFSSVELFHDTFIYLFICINYVLSFLLSLIKSLLYVLMQMTFLYNSRKRWYVFFNDAMIFFFHSIVIPFFIIPVYIWRFPFIHVFVLSFPGLCVHYIYMLVICSPGSCHHDVFVYDIHFTFVFIRSFVILSYK